LHLDNPTRDSLACDLMEPVRPQVDTFVLDWISREPLKREWFFEHRDGNCRLMAPFAAQLSETAPMWRRALAPFAEAVAQTLWASLGKADGRKAGPATRLTQLRNREAKRCESLPPNPQVVPQTLCRTCGASISTGGKYCGTCAPAASSEHMKSIVIV
jgi:hypothetical protein